MTAGPVVATPSSAESLRAALLRGSAWTLLVVVAALLLRLISNVVLWRLLSAEAFGLMGIVGALIIGVSMLLDVGIGPSIIQHERGDDPKYLNTAWTIQVLRGLGLFAITCLLAVPVAHFYHHAELAPLIVAAATLLLFQAFNSTKMFSAPRGLAFAQVSLIDMSAQLTGTLATIAVAWLTRSVWALTVSWVIPGALRLALGHLLLPGMRNRFLWDRSAVTDLMHFGRWVFLGTSLTFLAMQSDQLIFGKVLTISELGVYGIATTWATIPLNVLARVFGTVALPVLSRAKNRNEAVGPVFRDTREHLLLPGAWATSGLIAGASPLIRLLYDQRAAEAIWIIPILAMGGWFVMLENSNGNAALALGRPKWVAAANSAKVIALTVLVPLGVWLGAFPGAIVGWSAADVFKYLVSAVGAVRLGVGGWRRDLALSAGIVIVTLGTEALRKALGTASNAPIVDAAVVAFVVTSGWLVIWAVRARWHPGPKLSGTL